MRPTCRDFCAAEASALARSLLTPAPRCFARSGPSVLYIPEQRPAGEANWSWCAPPDAAAQRGMRRSLPHSAQGPRHEGRGGAGERVGARRDAARGGRRAGRGYRGAAARHRACQPVAGGGAARGGRAAPSGARRGRWGACRARAVRCARAACCASASADEDAARLRSGHRATRTKRRTSCPSTRARSASASGARPSADGCVAAALRRGVLYRGALTLAPRFVRRTLSRRRSASNDNMGCSRALITDARAPLSLELAQHATKPGQSVASLAAY